MAPGIGPAALRGVPSTSLRPPAIAAPLHTRCAAAAAQPRRCGRALVAYAAPPDGASDPPQSPPASRDELQRALKRAVAAENYAEAARLKQRLEEVLLQDPLVVLQRELQAAVEEERYQDAARLRDQLRELRETLQPPPPPDAQSVPTTSDTVTAGIRVRVQSVYVPTQSVPSNRQFFFAYRVTITNEGSAVVMLKSRHWVITDGDGHTDHVRGPGVVGEQPVLQPGSRFSYESACPLRTPTGKMEGSYQMIVLDPVTGEWGETVEVQIGAFGLNKDDSGSSGGAGGVA